MTWEHREARGKLPAPRYWHTASLVERKLIVWGGHNGKHSLKDLHLLDVDAIIWSQPKVTPEPPPPLSLHTCHAVDGQLFIFGGMSVTLDEEGQTHVKYCSDTWTLDCLTMQWSRLRQRGMHPPAVAYHTAELTHTGQLLVIGGWRGEVVPADDLKALDLTTGQWQVVPVPGEVPASMYGQRSCVVGTKVVTFGGWDGINPLNAVHVLDTAKL